jgi:hypothetical protein
MTGGSFRAAPWEVDLHAAEQPVGELVEWALRELLEAGGPVAVLFDHEGPRGRDVIRARSVPVEAWDG